MKSFFWMLCIFLITACFNVYNSESDTAGGLTIGAGDSAEFIAAKTLFSGSCAGGGCHSDFTSLTEAQFIAQGLVVAGDPDTSKVFCRLQGSTGSCGNKNMPLSQPALSAIELQVISDWILAIAP